jgi:hypothetical protein
MWKIYSVPRDSTLDKFLLYSISTYTSSNSISNFRCEAIASSITPATMEEQRNCIFWRFVPKDYNS